MTNETKQIVKEANKLIREAKVPEEDYTFTQIAQVISDNIETL